jgi:WD40 repeat protein
LGTYDAHSLRLWEVKTGRCVRVLEPPPKSVSAVGFSADGHLALSAGMLDSGSKVWRFPEGDCIREFPSSWGTTDAKISADGQGVLFATGDELQLFEVATGDSARVCRGHSGGVKAAAFVGNSKALSGGGDQTLKLWDLEANRCLKTYEGHSSSVESVAVSSDERYALSGSEDGTAKLWDLDLGQCIWTFAGHTGSIKCVSFSPDDGFVLTASADRSLGVWVLDWEWNI